jgi:agmatinase
MPLRTRFVYLDLPPELSNVRNAGALVLPIPYDQTSSYRSGSKDAPFEVIAASHQVELYDEELGLDVSEKIGGIATLEAVEPDFTGPAATHEIIYRRVRDVLKRHPEKLLVSLGGEHGITYPILRAFAEERRPDTVLHLDAHGDLRGSYEGTELSHASVMRRVSEQLKMPLVQVGVRSISREETDYIRKQKTWNIHYAVDIHRKGLPLKDIAGACGRKVYVSIDMDVFDGNVFPALGTPEPGGLGWYDVLDTVRAVAERSEIIGVDLNEMLPLPGLHSAPVTMAKLAYKMIGYAACLKKKKKR